MNFELNGSGRTPIFFEHDSVKAFYVPAVDYWQIG